MNKTDAATGQAQGGQRLPSWDELPTIPLYMDQVVLYLNEQLSFFQREGGTPLLTSSMVNNYVKAGAVPRPEKKKYHRRHLAALAILCMLKQVLPLQDVKTLLQEEGSLEGLYGLFCQAHSQAMGQACQELEESLQPHKDLRQEALRLAVEANAKRAAAERLLICLAADEPAS